jgi:hypothetical protein
MGCFAALGHSIVICFSSASSKSASVACNAASGFSGSDASPQSIFNLVDHRRHIYSLAENPGIKTVDLPARIRL